MVAFTAKARNLYKGILYNDINDDVTDFFRVLRDRGDELMDRIELTPCSRTEYLRCIAFPEPTCEVERAHRFYVRSTQAFRGQGQDRCTTWDIRKGTMNTAKMLVNRDERVRALAGCLREIVFDSRDAVEAVKVYDDPRSVFYADPPYLPSSLRRTTHYEYEMTEEQHVALAQALNACTAAAAVSGYPSGLYDELYKGWRRVDRVHRCMTAASMNYEDIKRTECMWIKDQNRSK